MIHPVIYHPMKYKLISLSLLAVALSGAYLLSHRAEPSGLAYRSLDHQWLTINDSPLLRTLNKANSLLAVTQSGLGPAGEPRDGGRPLNNHDWEAMGTLRLAGRQTLIIGDTGDNHAVRGGGRIHQLWADTLQVFDSRDYRFADGESRDVEALFTHEKSIYLISKRETPARIYHLAPPRANTGSFVAHPVASLAIPPLTQQTDSRGLSRYAAQPTGADLCPDRPTLVIATYQGVFAFPFPITGGPIHPTAHYPLPLSQYEGIVCRPGGAVTLIDEIHHTLTHLRLPLTH